MSLDDRLDFAIDLARRAGDFALKHFREIDSLVIESKGHQDLVSNADRDTETLVRSAIEARFPDDGIVGEEHGRKAGTSGYVWVIDPIDGTASFVSAIPQWCVAIACAKDGEAVIGVINEPASGELFHAAKGKGAFCNGKPIRVSGTAKIGEGGVGTGFSGRAPAANIVRAVETIVAEGGVFFRNGSGALMLAYVAAGRLLGYIEEHMNAWDCIAGLLIVEEAGGRIFKPDPARVLEKGTVVVAAGAAAWPAIIEIARNCFEPESFG
jgi:Archaeal fructose-1,6-bisphosphatase and related enzymes of inositol monophosphatase family